MLEVVGDDVEGEVHLVASQAAVAHVPVPGPFHPCERMLDERPDPRDQLVPAFLPVEEVFLAAVATVVGSLLLCLVAIAKPRYSFVFDPVLMLGAVACLTAPRETLARLQPADRKVLLGIAAFLSWGWVAWLIFSVSSRTAL